MIATLAAVESREGSSKRGNSVQVHPADQDGEIRKRETYDGNLRINKESRCQSTPLQGTNTQNAALDIKTTDFISCSSRKSQRTAYPIENAERYPTSPPCSGQTALQTKARSKVYRYAFDQVLNMLHNIYGSSHEVETVAGPEWTYERRR